MVWSFGVTIRAEVLNIVVDPYFPEISKIYFKTFTASYLSYHQESFFFTDQEDNAKVKINDLLNEWLTGVPAENSYRLRRQERTHFLRVTEPEARAAVINL